ncbi:MAG: hypothetical protein HQL23_06995 [Candidatus Omnitrophica bacterium]|nr:hypothetical protein [Candidatus Omnitrophota bacterium]
MNFWQIGMFFVLFGSIFTVGSLVYAFIFDRGASQLNRSVYLGETLLLGSTVLYGVFLFWSMCGLYNQYFLWGTVLGGYAGLIFGGARRGIGSFFRAGFSRHIGFYIFAALFGFFVFRNCFFLIDVDSHATYLLAQKLWLQFHTSIIRSNAIDARIYIPQFDNIFYSLSIPIFPTETFFPQLINIFFRGIAVLLVYGYVTYRFNAWYGVAASMFLLFNLHFYISGANQWVLMNGAIVALVFAACYNFYESRRNFTFDRFLLGLIFLSQLPSNKYQSFYFFFFLLALGLFIQPVLKEQILAICQQRKKLSLALLFISIAALHYVKNWITTGLPCFPVLGGTFHIFGRDPEFDMVFQQYGRGVTWMEFVKNFSFFYLWHGMQPAYRFLLFFLSLPLIVVIAGRVKFNLDKIYELCYWLSASALVTFGICLATHQDPRYYVYAIGVMTFTTIFAFDYVLREFFCLRNRFVFFRYAIILWVACQGWRIFLAEGSDFKLPLIKWNIGVLTNKIHTMDVIDYYFSKTRLYLMAAEKYPEVYAKSAWNYDQGASFSFFIVPVRPAISLWWTSMVRWKSYEKAELVEKDLRDNGIEFVLKPNDSGLNFQPVNEFAQDAIKINRFPSKTQFDYGFPPELTTVNYKR